jgi:hypothetical protein
MDIPVEEIKEDDKAEVINQYFDNVQGHLIGNHIYCNVPEFLLENQQKYIIRLEAEIEDLKAKIKQ